MERKEEHYKSKNDFTSSFKTYGQYLTLGFQLAASIFVFYYIGDWIDKEYEIQPLGKIIGTAFGMTGGFIKFFKSVNAMIKDEERNRMSNKREN